MQTTTQLLNVKRFSAVLLVLTLTAIHALAQVSSNYSFSQQSGTYTPITGGTLVNDGNLLIARYFDDEEIEDIPLGFTFNYNGSNFTTVNLSTNGFLTFNTIITTYTPISSTNPTRVISGFGTDLQSGFSTRGNTTTGSNQITNVQSVAGLSVGQVLSFISNNAFAPGTTITGISGSGPYTLTMSANATATGLAGLIEFNADSQVSGENPSELRYQTIGSAPNRTFVAQFTRVMRYGYLNDYLNFQIRLNENGSIEIVYGDCQWSNSTQSGAQVGLKGNSNSDFNNRQGTNWNSTTAGTVNTNTILLGGSNIPPVSGTTYRWTQCSSLPTVTVSPTSATICSGGSQVLTASGAVTYTWAPAATLSASTGSSVTASPTSTITYTVTGTDGSGCQNTATAVITVNTAPVLTSISGPTSVCPGTTTNYTTNNIAGATYNWSYSSNWITNSGAGTSSINVTAVDTCFVTVSATNTCGTGNTLSIYVNSTCPKPTGVTTTSVSPTSASISWNSAACNLQYTVQLKEVGTGVWTSYNAGTNTTFTFTGLSPLKNYQYKVINVCSTLPGSPILYGPVFTFATPEATGCGLAQNISVENITATSADITWDAQPAHRFRIRIRPVGSGTWTIYSISGSNTSFSLSSLNPATTYEFQIRTQCVQNGPWSGFTAVNTFSTPALRISESVNNQTVSLYPNPVTNMLNIVRALDENQEYSIVVLNTLGQVMLTANHISNSQTALDLSALPAGIYMVNIIDENQVSSHRIVKQ